MSNVYIKTKIRSGSYAMEYLRKIRKKRILVVCDKFLAESGAISYRLLQKVKNQLEKSGCRILGTVLNKVDIKQGSYYYYGKYGKYYGYGHENAKQGKEAKVL